MKHLAFCLVVLTFSSEDFPAFAQEASTAEKNSSAPIYLEEPEPDPPARVSRRQNLKETYEDKSVRVERQIARLSDDRVINDGKFTEYYRDGQRFSEGVYKMGVFEGDWKYWFPNGQLCKTVSFKKGKADGQWEVFDKDGKRTSLKIYQIGKRHGKWIYYHDDGEIPKLEISYDQGQPVGDRVTYFESGQKRQSISFKNGKMEGAMTQWYLSGKKQAEAVFKAGKLVGDIKHFNNE